MHRCLAVEEILLIIFKILNADIEPRCLAYLARTCKTFHEPAITILWSSQLSMAPLVRCLPSDAYVDTQNSPHSNLLEISRDLTPSDFNRIKFYAPKIRELRTWYDRGRLSPGAYALLLLHQTESSPLLPNIRFLGMTVEDFLGMAILPRLVVGRLVESLHINVEQGAYERSWRNMQTVLSPCAPNLKTFTISYKVDPRHGDNTINSHSSNSPVHPIQLLPNLKNLVYLEVRGLKPNSDALVHISSLPSLHRLDLNLCEITFSSFPKISYDRLTDLKLFAENMDNVERFLLSVSLKNLVTISIERAWIRDEDFQWDFHVFSDVLSSRHRNCPLTSISVEPKLCHGTMMGDHIPQTPLDKTDIKSLFVFPNISTLEIGNCSSNHLDDAMLMEISKAWPKLQNLCFQDKTVYDTDSGQRPSITSIGVMSFARSCPLLESLMISFNAEEIPLYATYDARTSAPSCLKQLDICRSPITDAEHVAQSLILAFPALQHLEVEHFEYGQSRFDDIWLKVDSIVKPVLAWRCRRK